MQPTSHTRIATLATALLADRQRVINGLYPAGEPEAGQPLKNVE